MYTASKPETILIAETIMTAQGYRVRVHQDHSDRTWIVLGTKGDRTVQIMEDRDGEYWLDILMGNDKIWNQKIVSANHLHRMI